MKLKGVNLGGWLVLEKWITPSLFDGHDAQDETTLCIELGKRKHNVIQTHYQTFITETDIEWILNAGLNAVRVPVGHWIFGDTEPYIKSIEYLDWLMAITQKYNLKVMINFHAAPKSQNGNDHSGLVGNIGWHKNQANIDRTIEIITKLTERYSKYPNFIAIELLNEPDSTIPKNTLLDFYSNTYNKIRKITGNDLIVAISDRFNPYDWRSDLTSSGHANVWLDMHLYQCFSQEDKALDIEAHIRKASVEWKELIDDIRKIRPAMIGEWSLGLDNETFRGMSVDQHKNKLKSYANAQLRTFELADGWFFWTYKLEQLGGWNFRHLVESGIMKNNFKR